MFQSVLSVYYSNGPPATAGGSDMRSAASPQVLIEPLKRARPGQFGGGFVITRRGVIVEAVLFAIVHVRLKHFVVGFQRLFIGCDADINSLVIACVIKHQRRRNLRDVSDAGLAAI